MDFPLAALGQALTARAVTWERLGTTWVLGSSTSNPTKAAVKAEFEAAALVGEVMVWVSGETELCTVRLPDERMVNKHYDLTVAADLDVVLDELVALLADGVVPADAVIRP